MRNKGTEINKNKQGNVCKIDFEDFVKTNFNKSAKIFLESRFNASNEIIDMFMAHPEKYPYCLGLIKGRLFINYYAACKHNAPLDKNDREDFEYLLYLKNADILVSDDRGFLKEAFDCLYGKKKKLFTLDDFILCM